MAEAERLRQQMPELQSAAKAWKAQAEARLRSAPLSLLSRL